MGIFDDIDEDESSTQEPRREKVDFSARCQSCGNSNNNSAYKTDTVFYYLVECNECKKEFKIKIPIDLEPIDE
jgi:transcription elongation factor Elf1